MENIIPKTLCLIDSFINDFDVKSNDFYKEICKRVSLNFNCASFGIFFIENTTPILKAGIKNNKSVKDYKLNRKILNNVYNSSNIILNTKKDEFLSDFTIISRLAIKNSIFGFCLISFDKMPVKDVKEAFSSISSIIGYKIKDYELNEVFKIQLKAMQEAFIEKENALNLVKKQHKKLLELDKTKSLFLANISHELRTPLNAIIGFSQALDSGIFGKLNEKQAEYIKDIQVSSLHLLGMINEILDISKLESKAMKFNPTLISPKSAIVEVINILEPLYKNKDINLVFNSDFEGKINADYQKFQQILYNLLSNAIKFTSNKGKIEIISTNDAQNYILKIKDNGIGIDKKYHNKIFKKFAHIDGAHNQTSTGLGLAITKELVKLHKGKINLISEINKGSTFEIIFKGILV